jgi:aspartate aminotransferase-like enzyme
MFRKEYLMTPGPTPLPSEVLLAQAEPIMHHRTPAYGEVFGRLMDGLKEIFLTSNDILVFASSGTGAMEAAVVNCFSPGDRVLVAHGGKFGERFRDLCRTYGLEVVEYAYDWGDTADPTVIFTMLKEHGDIKGVLVTHSETSTGVVNDIEAIGKLVRETPAILIVDSISGAGALEMRTDQWGVDVLVAGSQKALMTPPGLAAVAVSPKAWDLVEKSALPKYYFSFTKARKGLGDKIPQTAFTPAVSLTAAMCRAVDLIKQEGLEEVWRRHEVLAMATRAAVRAMGMELFPRDLERAFAVTAVKVPEGLDGGDITRVMNRKHGVIIAGGQSGLKGKIIRIGHVGYYHYFDVLVAVGALELTLKELGHPVQMGAGLATAQEEFYRYLEG